MGKWWKQWQAFFLGLQNDCRWWLEPRNSKTLSPWKKSYDKPRQCTEKQVHLVKAMVFPVAMYGCESWTIKKAEDQRIDAFELWCWRRLSWESLGLQRYQTNQSQRKSILSIHWRDWCWDWSSNILAIWCKEPTHWKRPWCWERLRAGGEAGDRRWDGWMAAQLDGHEFEQAPGDGEGQRSVACCSPWGCKESDTTERLNNNNLEFWGPGSPPS